MTTLHKRAYDQRVLEVDVAPAMRAGETVSAVISVEGLLDGSPTADLQISSVNAGGTVIQCKVAGGTAGTLYGLRIRFDTTGAPAERLEVVVDLRVS